MRIAYLCEFSHPSICGTWNRVYHLAKEMIKKGHEVHVLSSNVIKNTGKTSSPYEKFEGIHIHRMPAWSIFGKTLGESTLFWNFRKPFKKIKPDVIDAQVYRHPYTTFTPRIAKKLGAKSILTTHAPFVEKHLRSKLLNLVISIYDFLIGKPNLKKYDKIVAITNWEKPFLIDLGVEKGRISLVPNGIDPKYLTINTKGNRRDILFLGRVAPIKDVDILLHAMSYLSSPSKLTIVGPVEKEYGKELEKFLKKTKLHRKIKFVGPVYNLNRKMKFLSNSGIFVLPSKREGMPQSLLEAMAAKRVVITSSTKGGKELVKSGKNGFVFNIGDAEDLAGKIDYIYKNYSKFGMLRKNAKKYASTLTWKKIADKMEKIYKN